MRVYTDRDDVQIPIEELDEVTYSDTDKTYKAYVPTSVLKNGIQRENDEGTSLIHEAFINVEPYSKDEDVPLMFTPRARNFSLILEQPKKTHTGHFQVRRGMYVEGQTSPPVADALVTVKRHGKISLIDRVPKHSITDSDGRFKVGPVHFDTYDIEISKQDYEFDRVDTDRYDFIAVRKSRLQIKVRDSEEKPLAEVFISISAGKAVLQGLTDESGSLVFSDVKPQRYYLNAIKKEFSFGQVNRELLVEQNEHKEITIVGNRFAFSAHGSVFNLAGQLVKGNGEVRARYSDTDEQVAYGELIDGEFKLMGLEPGKLYFISIEADSIENVIPSEQTLSVSPDHKGDIYNLKFVAIERSEKFTIAGAAFF